MTDLTGDNGSIADDAAALAARLESAWNAGDGAAFTAPFADDADFVNVLGMHARGREAIAAGHDQIFRGIYAGSTVRYRVETARLLRPDVALVHLHASLAIPAGPMAGTHDARPSLVLTREGGEWRIASFHNTFIRGPATQRR
ncbi:MAG TPA: SgcJ/EcaC family oxidoreductase [Longimicrobium sp.]|jgi:uncharacterized protein (TIGR02246 family)|nr:SgcJ/EcaC family oxidoreductase [Longimicrobium sp.]